MRKLASVLPVAGLVLLTAAVLPSIPANAPSLSHELEEAADEIHEYLHDNYGTSYGAHELEDAAAALHDVLHEWEQGNATEAEVEVEWDTTKDEWKNFEKTIKRAKVLKRGDDELDDLYDDVKDAYKDIKKALKKVNKGKGKGKGGKK